MTLGLIYGDDLCKCGPYFEDKDKTLDFFMKDTLCGQSEFTNLAYVFIGAFDVFTIAIITYFNFSVISTSSFYYKT